MKNPAAVALGRLGGIKGGPARAAALSPGQRQDSARGAAAARWAESERVSCLLCRRVCASALELAQHKCAGAKAIGATREQLRSRRKRDVRCRTISVKHMTKREAAAGRMLYPDTDHYRPKTRAECVGADRPCPYVGCKWHLFLDVSPRTGAIKLNFPDLEPDQLAHSCVLDIADLGGETLEKVGEIANLTRERIRQLEVKAFELLRNLVGVLPSMAHFEYAPRALPVLNSHVEDTESTPGTPLHTPVSEAANRAESAEINAALLGVRGVR